LHATSASWLGGSSALWATSANWSGSPATVPGTGDTATFNANSANTTIDLGGGVTILNLLFNTGSAAAYTIGTGGAGAETLTLNDSGAITLNSTVASNQLFNAALTLGTATTASYTLANNSPNTLTLAANISGGTGGTTGTKTLTIGGSGNTIFGGNLNKGGAVNINLVKNGAGTFTVNPASNVGSASGSVTVNAGKLAIDFVNAVANASLLSSFSPVTLAGGTLQIIGNPANTSTQAFGGVSVNAGYNVISAGGTTSPTLTMGAFPQALGSMTMFVGPATIGAANAAVAATATITETYLGGGNNNQTVGTGTGGLLWNGTTRQSVATVGLYDWASTSLAGAGGNGTSPYTIKGGSQVTGFYTSIGSGTTVAADNNLDITGSVTLKSSGYNDTIRFNTAGSITATVGGANNYTTCGILVTPNVAANNITIDGATHWLKGNNGTGTTPDAINVYQNNTGGYLTIQNGSIVNYTTSITTAYVQGGPGTVVLSANSGAAGSSAYSAGNYLNGGVTEITADGSLGNLTTGITVNLNGGTLLGAGTFNLDNAGANARPITLLGNGGGLAATTGNTLTIDGQIGSAAGTGPLVIGIPASAANGSVAGLVPGTGGTAQGLAANTANTTPVYGNGTVALTYPNNAAGNFFYGGVTILGGATLAINSQYALGGGDQGPTTFNGGTLQYATTLATGAAGTALDISGQLVTLTGAGTIDVNNHAVTYANSIGNSGSGALTLESTAGSGGSLTLSGGGSYTGATTVGDGTHAMTLNVNGNLASSGVTVNTNGALYVGGSATVAGNVTVATNGILGGTGTISGAVNWQPGSAALFTAGSPLTAGVLTLNSNTVTVNVTGSPLSFGTYTLMNYTAAGSTGSFTNAPIYGGLGVVAGAISTITNYSGHVYLNVSSGGALATWTNNANGNWSAGANWSSNPNVPHTAGDNAILGISSAFRTVTLDNNETVGGILFTNPNSFAVASSGYALTLDNAGLGASVTATSGSSNAIQTAVSLNDNSTIAVSSGNSLTISGTISNAPSVIKTLAVNGAGTTILSGANTYGPAAGTVGTTLSGGGTLQVGNAGALGAGDVTNNGNVTLQAGASVSLANNLGIAPAVTVTANNNGNSMALNGVISGSGALTAIGGGTLTLSGNNTLTGNLTVNAGTLSISAAVNVASNIVLNGGDLLGSASFYMANNLGIGPTNGATPGTALIDAATGQTFELDGIIASAGNSGANNLTVNSLTANPGTVVLGGNNTFTGTTVIYTNTLLLDNPLALQDSTLNYDRGTLIVTNNTTATLGGLSGTNNLDNFVLTNAAGAALALTVGNNNTTAAYAGVVSGSGSLTKTGTGTQTIGSATGGGASYTGQTLMYNGTLVLDGNGSVSMNSGANNIYLDASLGVTALNLVDSAAVTTSGGVYLASEPLGGSGGGGGYPFMTTLTVQNNAVLNAGSLSFGNPGSSRAANGSAVTVTNSGTLNVSGTFDVMNAGGSQAGSVSVNLNGGTLAAGNFITAGLGSGAHANSLNFNGGTLQANASDNGTSPLFLPAMTDLTAYVNSNGLPFNANGYNVTIGQALVHGNGTPDGGLTVFGGGMLTLTNNGNTYTGITTVSNAVLSVNNTAGSSTGTNVINVLTNGYLGGSGLISGKVTVASYGHTLPGGTNGNATGVMTTVSNITYNAGAEADFNLSNNHSSGNDEVVVKGALNGNGVNIGISPTDLVNTNLDSTGDYVLFHVTGTYVSGFNVIPVWRGATPTNSAYYSVVYNGSDVVLHYSPITVLSASVTPNPATRNQQVTFTVNATAVPGIDPATGIYVNAAPIGGSSILYLAYAGGNNYTNSVTVTTGLGTTNLSYTVNDLGSDTSGGTISLTINSFTEVWDGLGLDNQWATGTNWVSDLPAGYGDAVTFAGTTQTTPDMESSYSLGSVTFTNGAGAFDITNSANTLTVFGGGVTNLSANVQIFDVPVSLAGKPTFNAAATNLVLNYPVADDGNGVIFAGANTTTLAGVNTYTGNTTISAGTLAIIGTGSLNSGGYGGNLADSGTLYYNSSAAQTLSGNLSGAGALVHNGNSTLTLSGANTGYSGVITVNSASTLLAGANTSLGTGTNILLGGTLGASVDNLSLNGSKLLVPSGTNGLVNMTSQMRLPALYGSGTLAINVNNANPVSATYPGDSFSACANFYGTLNITGNVAGAEINCYANGGSFDGQLQNATVNLITGAGGGVSLVGVDNSGGNDVYIGAMSVDAASSLGGSSYAGKLTYHIGALNGFSDIEGAVVNGSGGSASYLIKYGTGTLLLNNSGNTYTGSTTVSAGTLLVNGQVTASPVTVTSGGILSGVGILGGAVTNSAGALLIPGTNSIGTLTFNNNLTLNVTSTNRFVVTTAGGASNRVVVTAGTLTPNGSVIEINTAGDANLGAGTNVLFNYSGSTLANAFNLIPVFDTAQTGPATNAYVYDTGSQIQLVVTNPPGALVSSDASLSNLVVSSSEALSPAFNPSVTNYTATNFNANTSVTVLVTNNSAFATNVLYLNGVPQATNAYTLSDTVPVGVGNTNQIIVVVTAQDGLTTSTNTVTVTRLASANALLSNLVITPAGTLSPTFASGTTNYNATNTYANKSVTVTATSADGTAVLALSFNNGSSYSIPLTTTVASGSQTLGLPTNTVAVRAVSQDLSQTNVYTVNVLLQPSLTVPHLTNSVSGSTLALSWPADHLGYRLLVQTNNLNKGVSGNTNDWGTVAGTTTLLSTNIAIIKTGVTNEYYKLIYP
jgi:fibronectin-binding autotransporter adhesin